MHDLTRARALRRAPLALGIAAALTFAAVPAVAHAAAVPADAAHTGLYGAADPTYDGVYRQSLAILGLNAAGHAPDPTAVTWLLDQQCADGGFSSFNPDPSKPCAPFDGNAYTGGTDTNATALAVQALVATGHSSVAHTAAVYLQDHQNPDGGWQYTPEDTSSASDPNSTGLVLTALNAAGLTPTIDPAPYFLTLQVGRAGLTPKLAGDEGGITTAYSGGYGDAVATPQVIPGLLGDDLVDVPAPALSSWAPDATVPTDPPPTDAAGISDWAAQWLESNLEAGAVSNGYKAWAILSLAATATGRTAAQDTYAYLAANVPTTNPGALGQIALAAESLGETADADRDAALIAATLTTAAGRDPSAASTFATSLGASWVGQSVSVSNPNPATTLPLQQTVIWGDGSTTPLTAATATHAYLGAGTFRPTVRIEVAGFPRPAYVGLGSVTVVAPTATIKLSRSAAWLGTSVTLTRSGVTGNPRTATVAWGDGSTSNLTSAPTASHTYQRTGTFTPKVTLTNGTGGSAVLAATPASVKVSRDTGKPVVTLTTPARAHEVSSWRTLRGTARDDGTGVKSVSVQLVELRSGAWYAYDGRTWTKKASHAKALAAAARVSVAPASNGSWTLAVARLTKGTLTVTYSATDRAHNASATRTTTGTLTR